MAVIYKYPLKFGEVNEIRDGFVVHFGADPKGDICAWIMHYDDKDVIMKLYVVGTGHEFPNSHVAHGSCVDGPFVWHLIEEY